MFSVYLDPLLSPFTHCPPLAPRWRHGDTRRHVLGQLLDPRRLAPHRVAAEDVTVLLHVPLEGERHTLGEGVKCVSELLTQRIIPLLSFSPTLLLSTALPFSPLPSTVLPSALLFLSPPPFPLYTYLGEVVDLEVLAAAAADVALEGIDYRLLHDLRLQVRLLALERGLEFDPETGLDDTERVTLKCSVNMSGLSV